MKKVLVGVLTGCLLLLSSIVMAQQPTEEVRREAAIQVNIMKLQWTEARLVDLAAQVLTLQGELEQTKKVLTECQEPKEEPKVEVKE
uniref:Uncharacterized protein n=1 Tax=viral metagenome TaxID=1070528 RepID=A0A6M3IH03_9ZZZZ